MSETWQAKWENLRAMSREEMAERNPAAKAVADCLLDHWAKLEAARAALSNEKEKG
jgi:hypothetical protein